MTNVVIVSRSGQKASDRLFFLKAYRVKEADVKPWIFVFLKHHDPCESQVKLNLESLRRAARFNYIVPVYVSREQKTGS